MLALRHQGFTVIAAHPPSFGKYHFWRKARQDRRAVDEALPQ